MNGKNYLSGGTITGRLEAIERFLGWVIIALLIGAGVGLGLLIGWVWRMA